MKSSCWQPSMPPRNFFTRGGQTFPVDRHFAEEFIREETIQEIEDAKVRVAKAAGVEVSAVQIQIDMPFLVTI